MTTYNIWLTDPYGSKIALLEDIAYMNYSIGAKSMGYIQLGIQADILADKGVTPPFLPDRRIEVWRSPAPGFSSSLERAFFLRKGHQYQRKTDGIDMVSFYGRDAKDLLNRRYVIQKKDTTYTRKTDFLDDMMKEIVREQMLWDSALDNDGVSDNDRAWPEDLFTVQGDVSRGPSDTVEFQDKRVLDLLTDIHHLSVQLNIDDDTNNIIYFDVVEKDVNGRLGFEFQTFAQRRGADRTGSVRFSVENGNLEGFNLLQEYYEEANVCYSRGAEAVVEVEDTNRSGASPWARSETVVKSNALDTAGITADGNKTLRQFRPKSVVDTTFVSTPGDDMRGIPRSLYGVDWKLGDLLPINYRGSYYEAEVITIYVSVNDSGRETVVGKTLIGEAGQG
jgi:hypothetical protein